MTQYSLIPDLSALIDMIHKESIVSRTFYKNERMKGIVFGFDTGQELSEHSSSQSAIIQIIQGEAQITVGEDQYELCAGAWLHMEANLRHSITAKTPMIMLLMMYG